MNLGALVAAIVLLLLNGFFVAVEFALVASRRSKLEEAGQSRQAGVRRVQIALDATSDLTLELAGAQLGITIASLALGFVAEPAVVGGLESLIGPLELPHGVESAIALVLGLGLVVFSHLVIGEMVPKGIALADPERTMILLAVPNYLYMRIFKPVIRFLNASSNLAVRAMGVEIRDELGATHTAEELALLIAESHEEGVIEDFAHDLLTGVLEFEGEDVSSVMVRTDDMVLIPRSATIAQAEETVITAGHSRLPVEDGSGPDGIIGFVHSKDLLMVEDELREEPIPLSMIRRLLVVPPGRSLEDVLLSMRFSRVHVAIVRDSEGHTLGLVTLEDLLEQLVGDILDESDRDASPGQAR